MSYTPSTTLTVPTGGGAYTPSTTLTITSGGAETYTLSGEISITVFEDYTLSGNITINKVEVYSLQGGITLVKYDTYTLSGGVTLTVYETYDLQGNITINVEDKYFIGGSIEVYVYSSAETYYLGGAIEINITPVYPTYVLSRAIVIRVFSAEILTGNVVINKTNAAPTFRLSGVVRIRRYETFQLTRNIEIVVSPAHSGGTSGQGVGKKIVLPEGASIRWQLRVLVGGYDYSSRVSGVVNIDKERNSAVVASFSIRPTSGLVDPYTWVKQQTTITYLEYAPDGELLQQVRLFTGIVDTPIFDASSGLVEFTCTDDLQNVAMGSAQEYLAELTPLSVWSKYVYEEAVDGWEYLQQRLETYPYNIGLNTNQTFFATPWVSKPVDWEFDENCILDSSLSLALANSGDIVNSVDVTMTSQYDVYREAVFNLQWEEENWYLGRDLTWLFCDIQMICDSVSSSGATFVGDPLFNVIPSSRTLLINGNNVNFINDGSELLALEFRASVSKRYTQNTQNNMNSLVYSPASVSALGQLKSSFEGQIQVEYPKQLTDKFTATESVTKWAITASIGLSAGFETSENFITEPQLFQGAGWVYYPKRPYSFTRFKKDSETGISLASLNHVPTAPSGTYDFSFSAFGNPKQSGEHFYDLDAYASVGGAEERSLLLDTLKAQAKTAIVESHRQNTVAFESFIQPRLERGDMLRVNTPNLLVSGLVSQVVHTFDIDSGLAKSSIIAACSSVKALGIPGSTVEVYRLTGAITINVKNLQGSGAGIRLASPYATSGINYHRSLPCHYHTGTLDSAWEGHISPGDRTLTPGPHQFAIIFPDLLEANTENATISTQLGAEVVDIDQDELFLIST